jgi:predicted double-glycine peptidase
MGWLFLALVSFTAHAETFPPPETKLLMEVPLVEQSTAYTCGAAAMQGVFMYYGLEHSEESLAKEMGSTPALGTAHEKMAEAAVKRGIDAVVKSNLTLKDLADQIELNQPVIVEAQAWPDPERPTKPYPETWDHGHYMILIGIDAHTLYFVDPSLPGRRGFIPAEEFLTRWHDLATGGVKLHHTAILFRGTPKPLPAWKKIP